MACDSVGGSRGRGRGDSTSCTARRRARPRLPRRSDPKRSSRPKSAGKLERRLPRPSQATISLPISRREVEALKRDVAREPTTHATIGARTDVLWRWVNAYALTGGPIPVNLPLEVTVIRWGLADGRGPGRDHRRGHGLLHLDAAVVDRRRLRARVHAQGREPRRARRAEHRSVRAARGGKPRDAARDLHGGLAADAAGRRAPDRHAVHGRPGARAARGSRRRRLRLDRVVESRRRASSRSRCRSRGFTVGSWSSGRRRPTGWSVRRSSPATP